MTRLCRMALILASGLGPAVACGQNTPAPATTPVGPLSTLKVVGLGVQDASGKPVRLRGVNVACMEWASDGEGHVLETARVAIDDWRVNHVRLPLAQDRWFGKAPEQHDDGQAYRALVRKVVDLCAAKGCYVMLDLHWSDAGEWGKDIGQHVMPDLNSLTFWKDCAAAYKNEPAVIFDLYNEPHDVPWDVWLKGGPVTEKDEKTKATRTYEAAGMRAMLDAVRSTGARNVVVAGGLDWSYDLSGVLDGRRLNDPEGNGVIYANHAYPFKGDSVRRWAAKLEGFAKALPVIVSEFGSEPKGGAGLSGADWVREVLGVLESNGYSWTAWDMHPAAAPCLIAGWDYAPTPTFGVMVKGVLEGKPLPAPPTPATPDPAVKPAADPAEALAPAAGTVGAFEAHGEIGTVSKPGAVAFDPASGRYTVNGGGANIWGRVDAFHYAWRQARGDLSVAADVAFPAAGKDPHRKAVLMIRQGLGPGSAYVDVAVHGDGLTSLQFRDADDETTHEVQSAMKAPARVRLVSRGGYVILEAAAEAGAVPKFTGAAVRMAFRPPFYVGIGVSAHDDATSETATFTRVEVQSPLPPTDTKPTLYSTLETQSLASTDRRVVYSAPTRFEAPNWLADGKTLVVNGGGRLLLVPAAGGEPEPLDTGFAVRCNNDHGVSPDGKTLAVSDQSKGDHKSRIYTLPVGGGAPNLATPDGPSYWHGWSPDGKTLAYCADRGGEFDVYTTPAAGGGPETRLTTAKGLDDGPEYSPDGKAIYFNSDRTGANQLWRMRTDGAGQEQITRDDRNNWFPHPSPDGKTIVYVSFPPGTAGHPPEKDVELRRLELATGKVDVLGRFLGGQGTANVPCFAPDGRRIAFVTYQLIP